MKLERCPNCGSTAQVQVRCVSSGNNRGSYSRTYRVGCTGCGLGFDKVATVILRYDPLKDPAVLCNDGELADLVKQWNELPRREIWTSQI